MTPYPDLLAVSLAGRRPRSCAFAATEDNLLAVDFTRLGPWWWWRALLMAEDDFLPFTFTRRLRLRWARRGAFLAPECDLFAINMGTRLRWGCVAAEDDLVAIRVTGTTGRRSLRFPVANDDLVPLDLFAGLQRRRAPVIPLGATFGDDQRAGTGAAIVLAEEVRLRARATHAVLGARASDFLVELFEVALAATAAAAVEVALAFVVVLGSGICAAGPHGGWFGEGDRRAGGSSDGRPAWRLGVSRKCGEGVEEQRGQEGFEGALAGLEGRPLA